VYITNSQAPPDSTKNDQPGKHHSIMVTWDAAKFSDIIEYELAKTCGKLAITGRWPIGMRMKIC
jgi:hypothetical protein